MATNHGVGDRWLAGESIPGVQFSLHDPIEIVGGQYDGERGTISLLMALRPEPNYLVSLEARGDVRVRQSALRTVDGA